ncbi:MAG: tetratricopeptide repeat protein [Bacteroidota bacterium]
MNPFSEQIQQNEQTLEAISGLLNDRETPALLLLRSDHPEITRKQLNRFMEAFPDVQHLFLDLLHQEFEGFTELLEEVLPKPSGPFQVVHVLRLEMPLMAELVNDEVALLGQLEAECSTWADKFPVIFCFWVDAYTYEKLEQQCPTLWRLAHGTYHFLQEEALRKIYQEGTIDTIDDLRQANLVLEIEEGESAIQKLLAKSALLIEAGQLTDALAQLQQGAKVLKDSISPTELAELYFRNGQVFAAMEHPADALYFFQQSLSLLDEAPDDELVPKVSLATARAYQASSLPDEAIDYLEVALEKFELLEDGTAMADTYAELATCYRTLGQQDEELQYLKKAAKTYESEASTLSAARTLWKLGDRLERIGKIPLCIQAYQKSINWYDQVTPSVPAEQVQVYQHLGAIFLNQKDPSSALEVYQSALELAEKVDDPMLTTALEDSVEQVQATLQKAQKKSGGFFKRIFK